MASEDPASPSIAFPPTIWSRVRLAVAKAEPGADQALDDPTPDSITAELGELMGG